MDDMARLGSTEAAFDPGGLDRLREAARRESPEALAEAARQFEALFLHTLLRNMRESAFGEGLFDSEQSRLYESMFDQQIARTMADKGGIGLADILVRQLGGEQKDGQAARAAYEEAAQIERGTDGRTTEMRG